MQLVEQKAADITFRIILKKYYFLMHSPLSTGLREYCNYIEICNTLKTFFSFISYCLAL